MEAKMTESVGEGTTARIGTCRERDLDSFKPASELNSTTLSDAFGNQTISLGISSTTSDWETHGFAPLPHNRFAFIVCNRYFSKERMVPGNGSGQQH